MKKAIGTTTFALFAVLASASHASVTIFSSLSQTPGAPNNPYVGDSGGNVWGYDVSWKYSATNYNGNTYPYGQGMAVPFTVNTGYDIPLESVVLPIYKNPDGKAPNLIVRLVSNSGGLPNTSDVIETLSVNPVIAEDTESFLNLTSALNPTLENGKTYWITVETNTISKTDASSDVQYYWIQNNAGATFSYTVNQYNFSWNGYAGDFQGYFSQSSNTFLAPAMEIVGVGVGVGVPEPASLAVMGAALPLLLRRRK